MFLEEFKVIPYVGKSLKDVGTSVSSRPVLAYHLTRCSELESPHFYKIVDKPYLRNVILGILSYTVASGAWFKVWKLRLPEAQETFSHSKHLCHFLYVVI